MEDIKEALRIIIKHIRPDGTLYPFNIDEQRRLHFLATLFIEADKEQKE